jgi:hypothetical protein
MRRWGSKVVALLVVGALVCAVDLRAQQPRTAPCPDAADRRVALDTIVLRACFERDAAPGRAAQALRGVLSRRPDTSAIAPLTLWATRQSYRRAVATKRQDHFREVVELAELSDATQPSAAARFFRGVAAYQLAELLVRGKDCQSARERVHYLEVALSYPFRTDAGLEPDTMRIQRNRQAAVGLAQGRVQKLCSGSDGRAP